MRQPEVLSAVLLVGCLVTAVAMAGGQEGAGGDLRGANRLWAAWSDLQETYLGCNGSYINRTPTPEILGIVLSTHQTWLESGRGLSDERRANLCEANLQRAVLAKVNLQGADLRGAHLQRAHLRGAHLQGPVMPEANRGADLQGANLSEANLLGADLSGANFQKADLFRANLQEAHLLRANLQGAVLRGANLQDAYLGWAQLQKADLRGANLQRADLFRANLQEAHLGWAHLAGAIYEPNPESLPAFWTLTSVHNKLEAMVFRESPAALIALREAFKKAGMRTQERQLTYAIEHTKRLQAWNPSWVDPTQKDMRPWLEKLAGKIESLFSYVWFELPSGYGMVPGRTLQTLGLFIVLFSLPYMMAVHPFRFVTHVSGEAGIWMIWLPDQVHKGEGEKAPVRVTPTFFFSSRQEQAAGRCWGALWCGLSTALIGLYFSVLSAFSLGWRELNVGTWIARVQPREYTLRATGWVRTVSGLQSLLSVYLLAL